MFNGCKYLTSIDVSHFNTINVKNMGSLLDGCQSLEIINVSNFDTSNVNDIPICLVDVNL
jgi:surface protein